MLTLFFPGVQSFQKVLSILEKDLVAMNEKATQNDALDKSLFADLESKSQIKSLDELVTARRDENASLEVELKRARSQREKYQIEVKSLRERIGTLEEKDVATSRAFHAS